MRLVMGIVIAMIVTSGTFAQAVDQDSRIRIYPQNRAYWQYEGKTVLLLGGSAEDNLFQIPNLNEHLDLLASVGGNYVRCTMSSRDEGNVWPFAKEGAMFDLTTWNPEYWARFERFLQLTAERDIIVQIEVWATFDYYRDPWSRNPFNPKNNVNYTAAESKLPTAVNSHPLALQNPFFRSVPAKDNNVVVLRFQQAFVDKMLSYSLAHNHVLYCMDNETAVTPEWGKFWASHIRQRAAAAGVDVETTEMWDPWNILDPKHNATVKHPELYSFVDISQNNHLKGQGHWDRLQKRRATLGDPLRPLNCVKIYGADAGPFGNDRDGIERFWRDIFGGTASARLHRPSSGLGLNEKAQVCIKSMRMLTDELGIFSCAPHNDLLREREKNEAYCTANPGKAYAVYFPNGGSVKLDITATGGQIAIRWLDIMRSTWQQAETARSSDTVKLTCPSKGHWAVLVKASDPE